MFMIVKAPNAGSMAVRVLLVLAAFAVLLAVLYSCAQASSPPERQEKQAGVEEVGTKGKGEPSSEVPNITPPKDKTLRLTVPEMEMIKNDKIPTGLGTDEALFHDYAGVHFKNTGWPWEEEANVYIAGHRVGYENTNSWLAFGRRG
jgi:sortase A